MEKRVKELPKEKIEIINSIIAGSPSFSGGWLSFFPVGSEILFDNPQLSAKVIQTGIVASGSITVGLPYAIDIVRQDGSVFDIDRHFIELSGNTLVRDRKINKTFPEHHSDKVPDYYCKN